MNLKLIFGVHFNKWSWSIISSTCSRPNVNSAAYVEIDVLSTKLQTRKYFQENHITTFMTGNIKGYPQCKFTTDNVSEKL